MSCHEAPHGIFRRELALGVRRWGLGPAPSGTARDAVAGQTTARASGVSPWNDRGVDRDDQTDDVRGRLRESEELIRQEQLNPSDADGSRESDLQDMRELLLARIRAKTRTDR
jgi:hypothetical protein